MRLGRVPLILVATCLVLHGGQARQARAAAAELALSQACESGKVTVSFNWSGNDPTAAEQWLDLSTVDNGWQPGTFLGNGPLHPATTSLTWPGLLPATRHFVRINQSYGAGLWDASATFYFDTQSCPAPASGQPGEADVALALMQLAALALRGPAPMTGYSRAQFGRW